MCFFLAPDLTGFSALSCYKPIFELNAEGKPAVLVPQAGCLHYGDRKMTACYCDTDLCNSTGGIKWSLAALATMAVAMLWP